MANPTTSFGWVMPSATDLVTDLPADFDVFGQAVDTDFAGLLGGTAGQVLAKASGTDLDFVWSADAAGMTNPMTTTGDVIYSSSGSTPARLGIGSDGNVLTLASGVPSWAAPGASSSGMVRISTTAISGASGSITNCFSATYNNYLIIASNLQNSTTEANFKVYLRTGATNAANYDVQGYYMNNATITGFVSTTELASVTFNSTNKVSALLNVQSPFLESYTTVQGLTGGYNYSKSILGNHPTATSYESLGWASDSGNATGTITIYGLEI